MVDYAAFGCSSRTGRDSVSCVALSPKNEGSTRAISLRQHDRARYHYQDSSIHKKMGLKVCQVVN